MSKTQRNRWLALASLGAIAACTTASGALGDAEPCKQCNTANAIDPALYEKKGGATSAFWKHWGDGKAELTGYKVTTLRYGQKRQAEMVLIYVTEPLDRRTLVKDDRVKDEHKLNVLKLNRMLKFRTGIYPYSVMTSVFAPVNDLGRGRFWPAKIAFSAQEWCGHVFHQVRPGDGRFTSSIRSYFADEGEKTESVAAPGDLLYEDALLIQLRELDGPFQKGGNWAGQLVPEIWEVRKAHVPLRPVQAAITREQAIRDGQAVTRFTLKYNKVTKIYDVEKAAPRRILGWTKNDGEVATILKTARLPYWNQHDLGDESALEKIGLTATHK